MQVVETPYGPVRVIIPSGKLPRFHEFHASLEGLRVPEQGSGWMRYHSMSPAYARNMGVKDCLKERPDIRHFWFIDDDHMFDQFTLLRLLDHNLPVVCALTLLAGPPFFPILFSHKIWSETEHRPKWINMPWSALDGRKGLLPVYAAAGAGILVQATVFEQIPEPWFAIGQFVPDECQEDMYFYEQCHTANIPIFADLNTILGHTSPCTAVPFQDLTGVWWVKLVWSDEDYLVLPRSDRPGEKPKLQYTMEDLAPGTTTRAVSL